MTTQRWIAVAVVTVIVLFILASLFMYYIVMLAPAPPDVIYP